MSEIVRMCMSHKKSRDGGDYWIHPLGEHQKRECSDCGGQMGYIGELEFPSGSTPTSPNRVADLECVQCGRRIRNATIGGF